MFVTDFCDEKVTSHTKIKMPKLHKIICIFIIQLRHTLKWFQPIQTNLEVVGGIYIMFSDNRLKPRS